MGSIRSEASAPLPWGARRGRAGGLWYDSEWRAGRERRYSVRTRRRAERFGPSPTAGTRTEEGANAKRQAANDASERGPGPDRHSLIILVSFPQRHGAAPDPRTGCLTLAAPLLP